MKNAFKISIIALLVILYISIESCSSEDEWYKNGTLHKVTIVEWKKATKKNKLATCADFVCNYRKYTDLDKMKEDATQLMECIDESITSREIDDPLYVNMKVAEVAAMCQVLLKQ